MTFSADITFDWVSKYVSWQYCQEIGHLKNVVTEKNKRFQL